MRRWSVVIASTVAVCACSVFTDLGGLAGPESAIIGSDGGSSDGPGGGGDAPVAPRERKWRKADVSGPSARHSIFTMTYDAARERVVMCGGIRGQGSRRSPFVDMWQWDGQAWAALTPTTMPGGCWASVAYDTTHRVVSLFEGSTRWQWDGTAWTQLASTAAWPEQQWNNIVYDGARDTFVSVRVPKVPSGADAMPVETWELGGSASEWTKRDVGPGPAVYGGFALVYDTANRRVVVAAGRKPASAPTPVTWEYDGAKWTERVPAHVLPGRSAPCAAYDTARKVIVLFGGKNDTTELLADTWEWDGADWKKGPDGPPARRACGMVFDAARNAILMFGGVAEQTGGKTNQHDDTWIYD